MSGVREEAILQRGVDLEHRYEAWRTVILGFYIKVLLFKTPLAWVFFISLAIFWKFVVIDKSAMVVLVLILILIRMGANGNQFFRNFGRSPFYLQFQRIDRAIYERKDLKTLEFLEICILFARIQLWSEAKLKEILKFRQKHRDLFTVILVLICILAYSIGASVGDEIILTVLVFGLLFIPLCHHHRVFDNIKIVNVFFGNIQ